MKFILSLSLMMFALTATAAKAPGYQALSKMDAAIEALAKGGSGLATKKPGDVVVAGAIMGKDKAGRDMIQVDIGGAQCAIAIVTNPLPPGMIGAASYSGKVLKCSRYMNIRAPDVLKYEEVRPVLSEAAAKGKMDLSFRVTFSPQGPTVRLNK